MAIFDYNPPIIWTCDMYGKVFPLEHEKPTETWAEIIAELAAESSASMKQQVAEIWGFDPTARASDQVAMADVQTSRIVSYKWLGAEMADTEQVENRPKCDYRVTTKKDNVETTERCKSEKDLFEVKGRSKTMGRPLKTDICGKHLTDVWGKWKIDSADKRP